ncbi:S1 family peptidase [Patiriisocius hiemis]|uniref:Serine protease n=1 Tax=Patiriisocius hiemis TaxID=3075604 RepID=A0ABU2YGB2_9FLAO|nr:serine protease [Constantimarinum sp. W242]MDT0556817.1 serine protease [Constantimarinum sp. W242]
MIFDILKLKFKDYPFFAELALNFFTCLPPDEKIYLDIEEVLRGRKDRYSAIYSLNDFMYYCFEKNYCKGGFPGGVADKIVNRLVEVSVLTKYNDLIKENREEKYIATNYEYLQFLKQNKLLKNLFFGFNYIIDEYKYAVPIIEIKLPDKSISSGTGFIISYNNDFFVITNRHVVSSAIEIKVLIEDVEINFDTFILSDDADIAISKIKNYSGISFYLNTNIQILDSIITIGYPSIPMTKSAYQVFHRGEINSFVDDYFGNNLFLFSAKTSSGNSGSPVIDKHGSVIGIVCQELFEKDQLVERGILPYYAAIPSSIIMSELMKLK